MQAARSLRMALAVASAALVVALGAAGCSDDAEPSAPDGSPIDAVHEVQDAFSAEDMATICNRLTLPAQKQAAEIAGGEPTSCVRDVRRAFFGPLHELSEADDPDVIKDVDRVGSTAAVTVRQDDGWTADVTLKLRDGTWKLAGFIGVPPPDRQTIEHNMRSHPFPVYDAEALRASDGAGTPCSDLSDWNHPKITGGCKLEVSAAKLPIWILTAFGDVELASCAVAYRVSVAPQAHTWTNRLVVRSGNQPACSRIALCRTEDNEPRPWKGRLVDQGDGSYLHHMYICLRTSVGMFVGDLVMRLVPQGDGWRVEPTDRGTAGVKLFGKLAVSGGLRLRESRL